MASNYIALVAATVILLLIPGPNVAIIVATSLRDGLRYGLITALGTTAGLALQLVLVVGGMAALIEVAATALTWIKWAGVIYLLWLGIRTWNEPTDSLDQPKDRRNRGKPDRYGRENDKQKGREANVGHDHHGVCGH